MLARHRWLWAAALLAGRTLDNRAHAPQVRARTLVLLAEHDSRVPHALSAQLVTQLGARDEAHTRCIPGTNHNTLPRHAVTQQAVAEFLLDPSPPG